MGKIDRDRLYSLLSAMVDHYSPSGREEELTGWLADYMRSAGLEVRIEAVDENRGNLVCGAEPDRARTLYLGHIDTVPAYDIEQYEFSERGGRCYGLGTADMKGGCAAMIEAFIAAAEAGRGDPSALLALVVGEEETGDGTDALLETYAFTDALVAEPTGLSPCTSHFGYVEMLIRVYGYRRHAAMASRETNAIRSLLRLLLALEERLEGESETVLNIRDLHSSESGFAVPDRCAAAVDFHLPPSESASRYAEELERFVTEELENSAATRYDIEFPTRANGFNLDSDAALLTRSRRILEKRGYDWKPAAFTSHSDANLLIDAGCRPLILGPGQLSLAHTVDESVDFEEVVRAAEIYLDLLTSSER